MNDLETKGYGSRIVPAPMASDPRLRGAILDVVCSLEEEVQWHWTMTDRGRFVSGYSFVRRTRNPGALCDTPAAMRPRKGARGAQNRRGA